IAGNFHATKERVKKIGFTAPAWWYGPVIVVPKDNPANIKGFSDLKNVSGEIGAISGSNNALYLNAIGANLVPYASPNQELSSLAHGHGVAVVEDAPVAHAYAMARPDSNLKVLDAKFPADQVVKYGVGY